MTRESNIKVCALNIAMQAPHSPERYLELLFSAYRKQKVVSARGDNHALIGELHYINADNHEEGCAGELYRFLEIDPDEPWFNVLNREAANEQGRSNIKIPHHLKPHLVQFSFVFFPVGHRIYIQVKQGTKSISPNTLVEIFSLQLNDLELTPLFGDIAVTAIPQKEAIDEILRIPKLKRLTIKLTRPNPDDFGSAEDRVLRRMEDQGARESQTTLVASLNESLTLNDENRELAEVAANNGYVSAEGFDLEDKPVQKSTKAKPLIESFFYNSTVQSVKAALLNQARGLHDRLRQ